MHNTESFSSLNVCICLDSSLDLLTDLNIMLKRDDTVAETGLLSHESFSL